MPLVVSPLSFVLGAGETGKHPKECELTISFYPSVIGKFSSIVKFQSQAVNVTINAKTNQPKVVHAQMVILANVLEHELTIYRMYNPTDILDLSRLSFGAVFFGQQCICHSISATKVQQKYDGSLHLQSRWFLPKLMTRSLRNAKDEEQLKAKRIHEYIFQRSPWKASLNPKRAAHSSSCSALPYSTAFMALNQTISRSI
jgi:hypothetical protein